MFDKEEQRVYWVNRILCEKGLLPEPVPVTVGGRHFEINFMTEALKSKIYVHRESSQKYNGR